LAASEIERVAARLERETHRAPEVKTGRGATGRWAPAAAASRVEAFRQACREPLDLHQLLGVERREVFRAVAFEGARRGEREWCGVGDTFIRMRPAREQQCRTGRRRRAH